LTLRRGLAVAFFALSLCLAPVAAQDAKTPPGEKKGGEGRKVGHKIKEIAGSAEFLRDVPKHFATLKAVDRGRREVTLLMDGEVLPKVWPLVPDAEIKVLGWWGRLDDFAVGDRVWAWFKNDRKKQPVAITMLADEISQQDINGRPFTVKDAKTPDVLIQRVGRDGVRQLTLKDKPAEPGPYFIQTKGGKPRVVLSAKEFEAARDKQKQLLRERFAKVGLPGTISFVHVFSGEMDLMLDHETMRWARSLSVGDAVTLQADPPIKALVKHTQPWRERTQVRLVVKSIDLADL